MTRRAPALLGARVNGRPALEIAATDRGLHYGDGLFETLAVLDGEVRGVRQHRARLLSGCRVLDLPAAQAERLFEEGQRLARGHARAVLKLILSRGSGGRGYAPPPVAQPTRVALLYPWPAPGADDPAQLGVCVRVCSTRLGINPRLAGLKHLNRLEQVMARSELAPGESEGLMCDTAGRVIEGTMSNVFAVVAGGLVTPDLSGCGVAGVMRARVLARARRARIPVQVGELPVERLAEVQEMFVTNSIIGIWPVRRVGAQPMTPGPVTRRLQRLVTV